MLAEAAGLVGGATATTAGMAVAALLVLALGQGLAVPALGILALAAVPPAHQGAAGGLFFGYFDAGVGLGGPAVGLVVQRADPGIALLAAAAAVLTAAPAALLGRSRSGAGRSARPRVGRAGARPSPAGSGFAPMPEARSDG